MDSEVHLSHDEARWIREAELAFDNRSREALLFALRKLVRATECRLGEEDGQMPIPFAEEAEK